MSNVGGALFVTGSITESVVATECSRCLDEVETMNGEFEAYLIIPANRSAEDMDEDEFDLSSREQPARFRAYP